MTPREQAMVEWIAEKVCGWKRVRGSIWRMRDGKTIIVGGNGFNPLNRDSVFALSEAMEALETWRLADKDGRSWNLQSEVIGFEGECHPPEVTLVQFPIENIVGHGDTETLAICEALCAATGFKWKGEKDE